MASTPIRDWLTPTSSRPRIVMAAVTPTLAISSGPLSPTESEEEVESKARVEQRPKVMEVHNNESSNVDIIKLQCQVEQLTQIVQSRLSGDDGHEKSGHHPEASRLQEENAQLLDTIAIADQRLTDFQLHVANLQEDFNKEITLLKSQLSDYQEIAEKEIREKNEMKRHQEKVLKSKSVLETYIQGLPSKDEFEKLMLNSNVTSESQKRLASKMQDLENENLGLRQINLKASVASKKMEEELTETRMRLLEAETVNKAHFERLSKARESNGQDIEALIEQKDSFQTENRKLKEYALFLKKKYEKRIEDLSKKLVEKSEDCEKKNQQLTKTSEALAVEADTSRHLRQQVSDKIAVINTLHSKLEIMDREFANLRDSETIDSDVLKLRLRINKKLRKCVNDMQSLANASKKLAIGEDLNISVLLGVDHEVIEAGADKEKELNQMQSDLRALENADKEITDLRQILMDKYAESFAENCNVQ